MALKGGIGGVADGSAPGRTAVSPSRLPVGPGPSLHIVLFAPEIPANTGNVGRTCVATGCRLHLVRPLGFSLEDRYLRRAGLDYWSDLDLQVHADWAACRRALGERPLWLFATQGRRSHAAVAYTVGDALVFGPESSGLPAWLLASAPERGVRIPMRPGVRALNLSNAVAVGLYEALRQIGFPSLG
jgi:tRNA (cytidine/uridine-2'-O-)-methyltransferase